MDEFYNTLKGARIFSRYGYFPDEDFVLSTFLTKKTAKVLDVCCGAGRLSIKLAEKGFNVTGVDKSKTMIRTALKSAKRRNVRIKFICNDFLKRGIKEKFDYILIIRSLEVFTKEDADRVVKKCKPLLKKNGTLIITGFSVLNYRFSKALPCALLNKSFVLHLKGWKFLHTPYLPFQIKSLFEKNGFNEVRIIPENREKLWWKIFPFLCLSNCFWIFSVEKEK